MLAIAGPELSSSSPKQWKSDDSVKIYNSVKMAPDKIKEKKIKESTAI